MNHDLETLDAAFKIQESRIEAIEVRMDKLEATTCSSPCKDVEELRGEIEGWKSDLSHCSSSKDEKINLLASEVHSVKGSIDKIERDLGALTSAVERISDSLSDIARGLPDWEEVTKVYKNARGGLWILATLGKGVVGLAAVLGAWYIITHATLTVPK